MSGDIRHSAGDWRLIRRDLLEPAAMTGPAPRRPERSRHPPQGAMGVGSTSTRSS